MILRRKICSFESCCGENKKCITIQKFTEDITWFSTYLKMLCSIALAQFQCGYATLNDDIIVSTGVD